MSAVDFAPNHLSESPESDLIDILPNQIQRTNQPRQICLPQGRRKTERLVIERT